MKKFFGPENGGRGGEEGASASLLPPFSTALWIKTFLEHKSFFKNSNYIMMHLQNTINTFLHNAPIWFPLKIAENQNGFRDNTIWLKIKTDKND